MFGFVRLSKYNKVLRDKSLDEQSLKVIRRMYNEQNSKLAAFKHELEMSRLSIDKYKRLLEEMEEESVFTQEDIMFMIKCIHPDKHGNSSISNKVTALLLDWKNGK